MNEQNRNDMVNYRISRAKETIAEVNAMIEKQFWNAAVNRLYYACFYAVIVPIIIGIRIAFCENRKHFKRNG